MSRINFAYILLILALLTSCDNNYSYKKEEEKTKFKIIDLSYVGGKDILTENYFYAKYDYINGSPSENRHRISNAKFLLLDTNNDFEIEFQTSIYDREAYRGPKKYRKEGDRNVFGDFIGYNYFVGYNESKQKGYVVGWKNTGKSEEPVKWEVGSNTDSLISTLSYKTIKNMFPTFNGIYTQVKVDSIVIPHFFYDPDQIKYIQTYVYLEYTRIFGNHKWFEFMNRSDKKYMGKSIVNYYVQLKQNQ